jgi:hypothetical protein
VLGLELLFGRLRAGCFGKLCWLGDYFDVRTGRGAGEGLRGWVEEIGDVMSDRRYGVVPRFGWGYRVFFREAEGEDGVVAWLWDSRDRRDRRVPFALFASCPPRLLRGPAARLPFVMKGVWSELLEAGQLDGKAWPFYDRTAVLPAQEMERVLKNLRISRPKQPWTRENVEEQFAGRSAAEWLNHVCPGPDAVASFVRLLWHLKCARTQDGGGRGGDAFRFPYTVRESSLLQAAFWLALLEGRGKETFAVPPSLIIPEEGAGEASGIWILRRRPRGIDGPVLFMAEKTHDRVLDLTFHGGALEHDPSAGEFHAFAEGVRQDIAGADSPLSLVRPGAGDEAERGPGEAEAGVTPKTPEGDDDATEPIEPKAR